jgi:opacity protein-like surface antigen
MKVIPSLFAGVLLLGALTNAHADDGFYFGANYAHASYKEQGFEKVNPGALVFRFGKELNPNFALEGRVAGGIGHDRLSGSPVTLEIDHYYGGYGKLMLPLGDRLSLYGLAGFTRGRTTAKNGLASYSQTDGDVSYGFGADIALDRRLSLNLEVARLYEGDAYKVSAVSAGLGFKF